MKAIVNQLDSFDINGNIINNNAHKIDIVPINQDEIHLLVDNKSYRASVVSIDKEDKKVVLMVNSKEFEVKLMDSTDILLQKLGIQNTTSSKNNLFKAPMPGLVKQITVKEGQEVKKGDVVLVLEAMKMENALKASTNATIKTIHAQAGLAVEKGTLLMEFE
jgi:acetyl/propionyl-CoA carboxylase alpha subunit